MRPDRRRDGAYVHVAVVGREHQRRLQRADANVAVVGIGHHSNIRGNGDGHVGTRAVSDGEAHHDAAVDCPDLGREVMRLSIGLGVRAGEDLLVHRDVHLAVAAGAADGDVSMGVVDGELGASR